MSLAANLTDIGAPTHMQLVPHANPGQRVSQRRQED